MNTPFRSQGFPPIESNYTMCPNMFFDRVVGFYEPCVVNVVAILIRETLGWLNQHTGTRKVEAELPLSAFVKHGMSQESARKGLRLAAEAGLILKTEQASPKDPARYALRWEDPKTQQQAIKDERRAFQAKRTRAGGLRDTLSKRDAPQNRVLKSSTPISSSQEVRVLEIAPPLNKVILKKSSPEKKKEGEKKAPSAPDLSPPLFQEPKGPEQKEPEQKAPEPVAAPWADLPGERQQPFLEAALAEMRGNMRETPWDAGHSVIRTRARNLYHLAVKRGERP